MKRVTRIALAVATVLALTATAAFAKTSFTAHMTGKDQVPARATTATGQAKFTLSTDQSTLEFRVNVSNIENVVAVRLHQAPEGATGPEVATLFGPVAPGGGRSSGVLATGALTGMNLAGPLAGRTIADLLTEIEAGRIYINVVTDDGIAPPDEKPGDFSSGEIRGQLK